MHDVSPTGNQLRWVLLQVAAQQSGSLIYRIDPLAPAHEVLKENDVVMQIDGVPIADDGTVEFRNEERVEFSHIVRAKHIGEASFAVCPVCVRIITNHELKCFPAHDELGMCRISLVSPEQPVHPYNAY